MLKGDHLDFSHLTEFENSYITEIYMKKKQYKSSIIKNNEITEKIFFDGVPLRATYPLKLFLHFVPKIKISIVGISDG